MELTGIVVELSVSQVDPPKPRNPVACRLLYVLGLLIV